MHTDWTVLDQDSDFIISNDEIETGVASVSEQASLLVRTAHLKCMQKISKITQMMSDTGCNWSQPNIDLADTTNIKSDFSI